MKDAYYIGFKDQNNLITLLSYPISKEEYEMHYRLLKSVGIAKKIFLVKATDLKILVEIKDGSVVKKEEEYV